MIPNPYILGGAALALIVALGAGWLWGYDTGLQNHYEFKAKVEEQQHALAKENRELRFISESITRDVSVAWDRALRADRRVRVRVLPPVRTACDPAGLRPSGTASTGLAATAAQSGLYPGRDEAGTVSVEQCEVLANQGIVAGAQALHLIDYAIRQHEARK